MKRGQAKPRVEEPSGTPNSFLKGGSFTEDGDQLLPGMLPTPMPEETFVEIL